jgi:hypothetical protein
VGKAHVIHSKEETVMARTIHALLVGIDAYPEPINPLDGCVNDVETFAAYLKERVKGSDGTALELRLLRNQEATRDAVIQGFREHLTRAGKDDIALFYYAGHGAQEQAPPEFWHLEPDHLNETLVCYDSRLEGHWDLADKELAKLIDEVSAKSPHFAIILDCCHSGSGTRAPEQKAKARLAQIDKRVRPLSSYIVGVDEATRLAGARGLTDTPSGFGAGKYVLMAACRDYQLAKEYSAEGRARGAFSYFLNDTLAAASGPLSYRDLFTRAGSLMQTKVDDQAPQLEAPTPGDLDALFLDGAIRPAEPAYGVAYRDGEWLLQAGRVHGLPATQGAETIELALYPFDAPAETLRDRSRSLGKATAREVKPTTSVLEIPGAVKLAEDTTYKAVITKLPLPALGVRIEGESADGVALARAALAKASPGGKGSLYVREAVPPETPEFRLIASKGQYVIAGPQAQGDRPLVGQLDGFSEATAQKAIERLEHIARWTLTSRFNNPDTSIQPEEVELQILQGDALLTGRDIRLQYKQAGGKSTPPKFKVKVKNKGQRTLWVALLDLTQSYKISAGLQQSASTRLEPGQEFAPLGGKEISATVPDEVWKQGVVEYKDTLKLIVCTDEFDARLMEQPALDLPRPASRSTRGIRAGSLNRLMARVQTRDIGADDQAELDDWFATSVTFTTVRPLDASTIPDDPARSLDLAGGVKVHGHPQFKAKARLTTAPVASRDLGRLTLPAILGDDPHVSRPLILAQTRSTDPGLSVLELTDVEPNSEALVTPDQPLRLEIPQQLAPGEHVLPIGFDGEFFLPLGRAESLPGGKTEVVLDRIPAPTVPGGTRSLSGSIRIFFQKVVSQVIGTSFPYPILATADVADDETVTSEADPAKVKERVAPAKSILLFIHGIIGDTKDMAKSVQRARLPEGGATLKSRYDLVLTFDYENLNTPIEQIARSLKQRLEAVGLGAGHGKTLYIAAHSMGGLVSRWFIEHEGGDQVVQKLVMLGTPNGGSPWPNVVDWGTTTLALGLNHLTVIPWAGQVVGWLNTAIDQVKVDLTQMHAGSPVLKLLAEGPDPKVPYIMVAGNTSLPPQVVEADPTKAGTSILQRLLKSLRAVKPLELAANQLFAGEANDIAVSLESMRTVPAPHTPPYDVREVGCDHLTYFNHPAGLEGLLKALW